MRRRSNGHAKRGQDGVCINPYHYYPVDYEPFLSTLIEGLVALDIATNNNTLASLIAMRPLVADDKLLFEAMCSFIRCAPLVQTEAHSPPRRRTATAAVTPASKVAVAVGTVTSQLSAAAVAVPIVQLPPRQQAAAPEQGSFKVPMQKRRKIDARSEGQDSGIWSYPPSLISIASVSTIMGSAAVAEPSSDSPAEP